MEIQTIPFETMLPEWKKETQLYMDTYPDVLRELIEAAKSTNSDDTIAWFTKCLNHNVPGSSKHMFGLITAVTYRSVSKKDQLTPENLKLAHYLGWCVELLHSAYYVADDMMDGSTTRRGQLCWYKLEEVGPTTPNDVLMLESSIYGLLRKHFRHLDYYVDLLELFHEMTFKISQGQRMDYLHSKKSVHTFNMETYKSMAMHKTGCHLLYLPAALALHLAGVKDPQTFRDSRLILQGVGSFYQEQNDFMDVFVNPDITGKIGSDIESNKCSWLAIVGMQRANPEQKAIMVECYGKNDPQKIARVQRLYEEMNIPSFYFEYEKETYKQFKSLIEQTSSGIPKEHFLNILNFTMKDNKINSI